MTDPVAEVEALADLTPGDEWENGHMDGRYGNPPRPLVLADPERAKAYRAGYLAGRKAVPGPVTDWLPGEDGEIPL